MASASASILFGGGDVTHEATDRQTHTVAANGRAVLSTPQPFPLYLPTMDRTIMMTPESAPFRTYPASARTPMFSLRQGESKARPGKIAQKLAKNPAAASGRKT